MSIDKNITDTIKATIAIAASIIVVVAGILLYTALTNDENESQCSFAMSAASAHQSLDYDALSNKFSELLVLITDSSTEGDTLDIDITLITQVMNVKSYTESMSSLYPPTYETALILNSMVKEGNLFETSFTYIRIAWESKKSGNTQKFEEQCQQARDFFKQGSEKRIENISNLSGIEEQFCN